jgi:CheY-like chemotaxis protein/anti-sigma regulatory factor (Ser/Thr protein kinase)
VTSIPLKVLVVEDEPSIAGAIQRALERRGHRVTVVTSGEEALAAEPHEVMVSDLSIAGTDGLDLCERMLARACAGTGAPRIVLVSGAPTSDVCRRALRMGAADFLSKPFRLEDLVRAVEDSVPAALPSASPVKSSPASDADWMRCYRAGRATPEIATRDLLAYCLRCGIGPATRSRIGTAVAEVVTNACQHAYPQGAGEIELRARVDERTLRVRVSDGGIGFDTLSVYLKRMRDVRDGGLARASALSEDLSIDSRAGEGAQVRMTFTCTQVEFDEGRRVDLTDLDFLTPSVARSILERLRTSGGDDVFHLSPATAVTIGRLLSGPDPRLPVQGALWS